MPDNHEELFHADDRSVPASYLMRWSGLAVWDFDVEQGRFTISPELGKLLAASKDTYSWEEWRAAIHPDDREATLANFDALVEESAAGHGDFQYRLRRRDGEWLLVDFHGGIAARNSAGRPSHLMGIIHAAASGGRADKAERDRERFRFDIVTGAAEIGVWEMNHATGVFTASPLYAAIVDRPEGKSSGDESRPSHLCLPEDRHQLIDAMDRHLAGDAPRIECDFRIHDRRGETRWLRLRGKNVTLDEQGKPINTLGTIQDITELETAKAAAAAAGLLPAALGEAAQHLFAGDNADLDQTIFDVLDLLGRVAGGDGVALWQNHEGPDGKPLCSRIYAWSAQPRPEPPVEEIAGVSYERELPGWRKAFLLDQCVSRPDEEGSPAGLRKLGENLGDIAFLAAPVRFGDEFWGFILFRAEDAKHVWDAPTRELFKTAGQLIASAINAGRVNRELAADLGEARENARLAIVANQERVELLSDVSRDINETLDQAAGLIEALLASDLSSVQREQVMALQHHMADLSLQVRGLSDFTTLEAGHLRIDATIFDPVALVEDVCDPQARRAHRKGLDFSVQIDSGHLPLRVVGDPERLRQALGHLVANAVAHTEKGEVVVQVVGCDDDEGRRGFRFAVMDTGPEPSESQIGRIFSQGETETNETETQGRRGAGLELVICKSLVELMGGDVGLFSRAGEGSTFWFRLPLAAPEGETEPLPLPQLGGRALIIDDNANVRIGLTMPLTALGVAVHEAGDMAEAARIGAEVEFDWIFVDATLPGERTDTLARILARMPGAANARRILLFPYGQSEQAVGFSRLGFSAVLFKPVHQSLLHECLFPGTFHADADSTQTSAAPAPEAAGAPD